MQELKNMEVPMATTKSNSCLWNRFTYLYPLQKTIRFELVPVGSTYENIEKNNIIYAKWKNGKNETFGIDAEREKNFEIIKNYLDEAHRLFIENTLSIQNLKKFEKQEKEKSKKKSNNWEKLLRDYYNSWVSYRDQKPDKTQETLPNDKKELYKKFLELINFSANNLKNEIVSYYKKKNVGNFKIEDSGIKILYEKSPIKILKYYIDTDQIQVENKDELLQIINTFNDFKTYLYGFNKNRANVYDVNIDNPIKTSLAFRIFEENLEFFILNIVKWESFSKAIDSSAIKYELKAKKWDIKGKLKELSKNLIEPKFNKKLEEFFKPEMFIYFLSQTGIDHYNEVIGGRLDQSGKVKIQGINELINLTMQKISNPDKKNFPTLHLLYKQILSDRKKELGLSQFKSESEMLEAIKKFTNDWKEKRIRFEGLSDKIDAIEYLKKIYRSTLNELKNNPELKSGFFLSDKAIREISIDILGGFNTIHSVWFNIVNSMNDEKGKPISKKLKDKHKRKKYFSFQEIEKLVTKYVQDNAIINKGQEILPYKEYWQGIFGKEFKIEKYIQEKINFLIDEKSNGDNKNRAQREGDDKIKLPSLMECVDGNQLKKILSRDSLNNNKESILIIKEYLDAAIRLIHFVKNFQINEKDLIKEIDNFTELNKSSQFINLIEDWVNNHFDIFILYNKVRNFVTKKEKNTEKIKVNFDNPTFLSGWDVEKETSNYGFLLMKDNAYYLGIADKTFNTYLGFFDSEKRREKIEELKVELEKLKNKKQNKKNQEKIQKIEEELNELESIENFKKGDSYKKIWYKYMPDLTKMIPKCSVQMKEVKNHFKNSNKDYILNNKNGKDNFIRPLKITKEIFLLNNTKFDKQKNKFLKIDDTDSNNNIKGPKKFQKEYLELTNDRVGYQKALHTWINFCIDFLKSYNSCQYFDYSNLKKANQYESLDEFYADANSRGYKIKFENISKEYIHKKVNEGKIYLFKIHNKDFSSKKNNKNSRDNLHTSYWKLLFDEKNLNDVVLKLNGQAEVFYRPAMIKNQTVVHHKNEPIENKNPQNPKKTSKFNYDIIKDKRFTENKFLFHCPITLNFKVREKFNLNKEVQNTIAQNPEVNIIGIDRGERNLLYYSVINQDGEILESGSFNLIKSEYTNSKGNLITYETDYHKLLNEKEQERKKARENWDIIENIKELKQGYLSHVIHKIAQLVIKYNAIVILEDLNSGFKRGRFKIEKQVYQNFEKALIQKLNYLVFKDRKNPRDPGGYLNAYQLTDKFESFQNLGKQSGILFYTSANYTSKVDPVSGFMQNYYGTYDPSKKEIFLNMFESIVFNGRYFEIIYNLDKNNNNNNDIDLFYYQPKWTVVTNVIRSLYDSKNRRILTIDVNEKFKELLKEYNIEYKNGENIIDKIKNQDKSFIKKFHDYFKLIQNVRVSTEDDSDFIQSPVYPFYDSRKLKNQEMKKINLPENGDANGAYNIARKGIILLKKLSIRAEIEKLLRKNNNDINFNEFNDKNKLKKLFNDPKFNNLYQTWIKEYYHISNKDNKSYENKKENKQLIDNFIRYISDLTVTKSDWESYIQNPEIVQKQVNTWRKIIKS